VENFCPAGQGGLLGFSYGRPRARHGDGSSTPAGSQLLRLVVPALHAHCAGRVGELLLEPAECCPGLYSAERDFGSRPGTSPNQRSQDV